MVENQIAIILNTGTGGQNCGGQCRAVFQDDGNFVVFNGYNVLWTSNTGGVTGANLVFSGLPYYLAVMGANQMPAWFASWNISGQVVAGGSSVPGVTMAATGTTSISTITDANGSYSLTTPAGGNYTVTASLSGYNFSPGSDTFNALSTNQTANYSASTPGDSNPDPAPTPYPDNLSPASAPSGSCNFTGNWADSLNGATWSLTQLASGSISGNLNLNDASCGNVTWQVAGQASGNSATFTASSPSPSVDLCGYPAASNVSVNAVLGSCSSGTANETATFPSSGSGFGSGGSPGYTRTGTATLTLTTQVLTFALSSASQVLIPGASNNAQMIPMWTGDHPQMTTAASLSSYPVDVVYSSVAAANLHSTCAASLTIPEATGTGSASSTLSASPSGCSGIFGVYGNVGGTTTQNAIDVVVPPDILIRELWGEANTQAAVGDQVSELAVGSAIRQRFSDSVWFAGFNNYQDMDNVGFNGLSRCGVNCLNTFPHTTETLNAAYIYGGVNTPATNVSEARCFISPTPDDWNDQIMPALQSKTIIYPGPLFVRSTCFPEQNRQLVYKLFVGDNASYSDSVPAFLFIQYRISSAPAVIQIP